MISAIRDAEQSLARLRTLLGMYRGPREALMTATRDPDVIRIVNEALLNNDRVGFLGPEGSYSHEVALKFFGGGGRFIPYRNIEGVIKGVYQGEVALGVVPIENNLAGVVGEAMDGLIKWRVYVNYAVEYRITLCLVVNDETSLSEVREVYSHPHAIAEALSFVSKLGAEVHYTQSTSEALEAVKGHRGRAAIASRVGAEIHGLRTLVCGIEDRPSITRFLVISRQFQELGDRSLAIFSVPNKPGSLFNALRPFADLNINLSMIYSRPNKSSPWGYDFLLEAECELRDARCRDAFNRLRDASVYTWILGSYLQVSMA
ncbi:prephenate dehydratase [Vulcanisaeta thermophila]|uniref:prephenate dehydratase n=1 Tax=Vulcanisaeta thermophila TaxID=867917 RepID=UPI000A4B503D|nr:prephenate dehydratase domain-containing protein [Vulcanisaeta thermophila]